MTTPSITPEQALKLLRDEMLVAHEEIAYFHGGAMRRNGDHENDGKSNSTCVEIRKLLAATSPDKVAPAVLDTNQDLIEWVCERWNAEIANRPLVNVYRRNLDHTWRQMLRHLGADDRALLGPTHDELLAAAPKETGK